jgi:lysophospholipase L1-like esterase
MKISILFACLLSGNIVFAQTPYDSLYLKSSTYKHLTAHFALSKMSSADVVFLGNSITFGGAWNELLGRERIVNRGIGGDNTVGMLHRLQYVYQLKPKLCFVMAGINDIYADVPVERIFNNYKQIIDTLMIHRITPVIQSTLLVNPKWKRAAEKNIEVKELNRLLMEYAVGKNIEYVDLNAVLSINDVLKEEYTTDGVHLTAMAYDRWRELLLPILIKHGL